MQTLRWYFDFISPFAWLQLQRLQRADALVHVEACPILFAAVLDAVGQRGPAEIEHKRAFTYRFVQWQAEQLGLPLVFPPVHPFNPLQLLRLSHALGNRWDVVHALFAHVWAEGRDPADDLALDTIARRFGADLGVAGEASAKQALRDATERALARGVFGVPTLEVGGQLFWGQDSTDFALACAADPGLLTRGEMARLGSLPIGVQRK